MKKISKSKSIIISVIICVCLLLGCFFAFVPFKIGTKDYLSFIGNQNVSGDLKEGVYAEYTIVSASTDEEIESSVAKIRNILSDSGYVNANVLRKGDDCIRVDVKGSNSVVDFEKCKSFLSTIASGKLEIKAGNDSSVVNVVDMSKHLKDVSVKSSNSSYYVVIELNDAGTNVYKDLTAESIENYSGQVYMYMGGEAWPSSSNSFSINEIVTNGQIALTVESYSAAEQFVLNVECGALEIEMDSDNIDILYAKPFMSSRALIVLCVLLLVVALGLVAYVAVRFRLLAVPFFAMQLFNVIVGLFLMQAMDFVELDISSLFVIGICFALISVCSLEIFKKAKYDYTIGKPVEVSLTYAFSNSVKLVCDYSIIPAVFGLIIAFLGNTQIQTLGVIVCLFGTLNLLGNCVLMPLFTNLFVEIFGENSKLYGFKREEK